MEQDDYDFIGAALDLESAASAISDWIDQLDGVLAFMKANGGGLPANPPDQFLIRVDDVYAAHQAGERAFFRHIELYPQLETEWIKGTRQQWGMTFAQGQRNALKEKQGLLMRSAAIVRARADPEKTQKIDQAEKSNFYLGDVYMGHVIKNVSNSTILTESIVKNAFNTVKSRSDEQTAEFINALAEAVAAAENAEAGQLLDQFNEELTRDEPRKSLLKRSWDALVDVLPSVAKIAGASAAIGKLLS